MSEYKMRGWMDANAFGKELITADLLAQLKRMVTYYDSGEMRPEAVEKIKWARVAIAKAEGRGEDETTM